MSADGPEVMDVLTVTKEHSYKLVAMIKSPRTLMILTILYFNIIERKAQGVLGMCTHYAQRDR